MKNKNKLIIGLLIVLVLGVAGYIVYDKIVVKNNNSGIQTNDNKNGKVIYMCGTSNENGNFVFKEKGETIDKNSICKNGYIGKYVCNDEDCYAGGAAQYTDSYRDFEKGIAVVENDRSVGFLYDFKNSKKLSDNYHFSGQLYDNHYNIGDRDYIIISNDSSQYGIIRSDGKLITNLVYDYIFTGWYDGEELGHSDSIIPVMKNNKIGFLNFKTGLETTEIKYANSSNSILGGFNIKYNLAYVKDSYSGNSYVINTTNGNVLKEFNKSYNNVLPLKDNMMLIVENNTFDIVDYNLKSLLDKKVSYNGDIGVAFIDSFTKLRILINHEIEYIFDLNTKKLTKATV